MSAQAHTAPQPRTRRKLRGAHRAAEILAAGRWLDAEAQAWHDSCWRRVCAGARAAAAAAWCCCWRRAGRTPPAAPLRCCPWRGAVAAAAPAPCKWLPDLSSSRTGARGVQQWAVQGGRHPMCKPPSSAAPRCPSSCRVVAGQQPRYSKGWAPRRALLSSSRFLVRWGNRWRATLLMARRQRSGAFLPPLQRGSHHGVAAPRQLGRLPRLVPEPRRSPLDMASHLASAGLSAPPIHYIYTHLHNSIRSELASVGEAVARLQQAAEDPQDLGLRLAALQDKYRFLSQVYMYHSSVEDEASVGEAQPRRSLPPHAGRRGAGRGELAALSAHQAPALARTHPLPGGTHAGCLSRPGLQSQERHACILCGARG